LEMNKEKYECKQVNEFIILRDKFLNNYMAMEEIIK
jgi:hypothetical protein